MPTPKTIKRKNSRGSKGMGTTASKRLTAREAKIKKFVDRFYRRYGNMMSRLSHE